jgi:hypothetical protein
MKKFEGILAAIFFLALMSFGNPVQKAGCEIMKSGTFKYEGLLYENKIVINGDKHTEFHYGEKYKIESTIKWLNDCEYDATLVKSTLPNFPYNPGDVMHVKINKVDGSKIYITSTVNGKSWDSVLSKVK